MKKQAKAVIGVAAVFLVLVVIGTVAAVLSTGNSAKAYDEHLELAQQYLDNLQYEQAIAEYEAAIAIEPNNEEAYVKLAETYVAVEEYESAIETINRGIEQTNAERLLSYLTTVQEVYTEAQGIYADTEEIDTEIKEEGINKNTLDEDIYNESSKSPSSGMEEETDRSGDTVEENVPTYEERLELAKQYVDEQQYEKAIEEYESLIREESKRVEAYLKLAELYVQMDEYEAAIDVLNRGIEQTKSDDLTVYLEKVQKKLTEEEKQEELTEGENRVVIRTEIVYDELRNDGSYQIDEYDTNERLVKSTDYFSNGEASGYKLYFYDKNGMEVKREYYNAEGILIMDSVCEYRTNGNKLRTIGTSYFEDGTITRLFSEYDAYSRLVKESSEEFGLEKTYDYDINGNMVKETSFDPDGTIYSYVLYDYDVNGNKREETHYVEGAISWHWECEYHDNGKTEKTTLYYEYGYTGLTVYEYGSDDNCIRGTEYMYNPDGTLEGYYVGEYDESGNRVSYKYYNAEGTVIDDLG